MKQTTRQIIPNFSSDYNDCFNLVINMRIKGFYLNLRDIGDDKNADYLAEFTNKNGNIISRDNDKLPIKAICKAALEAMKKK